MEETALADDRISVRVPTNKKLQIEAKARECGKRSTDWVRDIIDSALEGPPIAPPGPAGQASAVSPAFVDWLERRFQALEIRATHNRNACLFAISMALYEAIKAGSLAKIAATTHPPDDEGGIQRLFEAAAIDWQTHYENEFERGRTAIRKLKAEGDQEALAVSGSVDDLLAALEDRTS